MILSKIQTYFLILLFYVLCCALYQTVWMISSTSTGTVLEFGHGVGEEYHAIENVTIQYYVNNKEYIGHYLRNGINDTSSRVSIRYLLFAPCVSKQNTLVGNWSLIMGTFAIFFPCLSILFFSNGVFPKQSRFILKKRAPFLTLLR